MDLLGGFASRCASHSGLMTTRSAHNRGRISCNVGVQAPWPHACEPLKLLCSQHRDRHEAREHTACVALEQKRSALGSMTITVSLYSGVP
jgi:hypothetical protein